MTPTPEELNEYAFVTVGPKVYLGKCGEVPAPWSHMLTNAIQIDNVFLVLGGYMPTEQNTIARARVLVPVEMFPSAKGIMVIPNDIFPLSQLDAQDKFGVIAEINAAEKSIITMRAKRSGLVMPPGVRA